MNARSRSQETYEHLTDAELAMQVYLAIIRHDDDLPDEVTDLFWEAQHMASVLYDRLVGPYCQADGCTEQRMRSFPWCRTPGHDALVKAQES